MRRDNTVEIQSVAFAKNAQGIPVPSYTRLKTISCNVQPYKLNETEMKTFGIDDRGSNTKLMFMDPDTDIVVLQRAVVDGFTYEIRAINNWPHHWEAILVPVVGL